MINAWKILRLAIRINRETKNGMAIITCPQWQHAEVKAHIWAKNVERAAEKWSQYDDNISPQQWQEAMTKKTHQQEK